MLCHTVPLALFSLGQPLPAGVDPLPALVGAPYWATWRPESLGSIESEEYPVACHWAREQDEDRCPAILEQIELSWRVQVEQIGFNPPVPDDDGVLDVYLTNEGTGGGAYAYGPSTDEVTGDDQMSTAAYIAIDYGISDEEMPGYTTHEFNHVLQYATDFTEPTYMIWESIASAAERWTIPEMDVYSDYAKDFQKTPWLGILGDGTYLWDEYQIWSYYEYGGYVWAFHLDHSWGDGTGGGARDLWAMAAQEGNRNEPDVLDAYDELSGDWRQALLDLSLARAQMGTERAPAWAPWTGRAFMPTTSVDIGADELPTTHTPEIGAYETGTVYLRITDLPVGTTLDVAVESGSDVSWGWVLVQGGTEYSGLGNTAQLTTAEEGDVLLGIVNLGAQGFDGDDTISAARFTVSLSAEGGATGDGGAGDGGAGDGGAGEEKGGCGCSTPMSGGGILVMPLMLWARRRR